MERYVRPPMPVLISLVKEKHCRFSSQGPLKVPCQMPLVILHYDWAAFEFLESNVQNWQILQFCLHANLQGTL